MKKLNAKGFTLIELLAVITIMGILMMVAIPTVSRTIENSRKDTFLDTANQYVNGVKNMWASDTLNCSGYGEPTTTSYVSSAVPEGLYYVEINTTSSSVPVLLEQGGKSSWGSRDVAGYIVIAVDDVVSGTKSNRKVTYYPVLVDGIHGINVTSTGAKTVTWASGEVGTGSAELNTNITRGDILMSGAAYTTVVTYEDSKTTLTSGATIKSPGTNIVKCTEV